MKLINIETKNQLLALKYTYDKIIFFIYGDTCAPCNILKPKLFKCLENIDVTVITMNYKSSNEINEYFELKKIPFLIFCKDSKIINSIQTSKLELLLPILNESLNLNVIDNTITQNLNDDDFDADFDF